MFPCNIECQWPHLTSRNSTSYADLVFVVRCAEMVGQLVGAIKGFPIHSIAMLDGAWKRASRSMLLHVSLQFVLSSESTLRSTVGVRAPEGRRVCWVTGLVNTGLRGGKENVTPLSWPRASAIASGNGAAFERKTFVGTTTDILAWLDHCIGTRGLQASGR